MGDQTRFQRWESGLLAMPPLISERDLDICLMKQSRRIIQRGGYLQFENFMYRGEYLAGYAGKTVVLRYDPRDITTVLVYQNQGEREVFLARAYAQDEVRDREIFLTQKKTKKERQKVEQVELRKAK
jgi:putative transposase